jgi:hypothetical protein
MQMRKAVLMLVFLASALGSACSAGDFDPDSAAADNVSPAAEQSSFEGEVSSVQEGLTHCVAPQGTALCTKQCSVSVWNGCGYVNGQPRPSLNCAMGWVQKYSNGQRYLGLAGRNEIRCSQISCSDSCE